MENISCRKIRINVDSFLRKGFKIFVRGGGDISLSLF